MHRSLPSLVALIPIVAVLTIFMFFFEVTEAEVAVVRTFGKIQQPAPVYRFDVDATLLGKFKDGEEPSKALRDAFARNNYGLSDQAILIDESKGEKPSWHVEDRKQSFLITPTDGKLRVSELVSPDVRTEAGPYWRWPWPVQSVTKYDDRIQTTISPPTETPTKDGKPIIISTAVQWRVADPYKFSTANEDWEAAERALQNRIRNEQNTIIGNHNFSDFISPNSEELRYDEIERSIFKAVRSSARRDFGIDVKATRIEKFALPAVITKTVFSAMKKEREAEAAKYTTQGESTAAQIKAEAEGIAETIRAFAKRTAAEIEAEGIAQAAKYNETFRKDEALAVFLIRIETLPEILKDRTTILFDQDSPLVKLFTEAGAPESPAVETQPGEQDVSAGPPLEQVQ